MRLCLVVLFVTLSARPAFPQTAETLLRASDAALSRGDYTAAIQAGQQAAALAQAATQPALQGQALNNVGAAHLYQGDYPAALTSFTGALALFRNAKVPASEVMCLNNIGSIHFYQGRYGEALSSYQAAEKRLAGTEQQPWHHQSRQLTLTNIAVLYQQLGQHQRALDFYRELQTLPGKQSASNQAQILTNLAVVYRRLGDAPKAMETYAAAQRLLEQEPDAAAALYTLHNIGVAQALDLDDLPAALRTFEKARAQAERRGSKRDLAVERLFLGETLLRMGRLPEARSHFAGALTPAQAEGWSEEKWTALYGLGRVETATGARQAAMQSFRAAIGVIESARSQLGSRSLKTEFLAGKRDVYDALIALLLDQPEPPLEEILLRIEQGRSRNLKEALPAERTARALPALQQALDSQTLVLEYWVAGGRLALIWFTRDAAGVVRATYPPEAERQVEELGRRLASRHADWQAPARAVAQLLLSGLAPLNNQKLQRLLIVPDGPLLFLPFEVLDLPGGQRVLERFDVGYLPSAHFLSGPRPQAARRWPWQTMLTAFADPIALAHQPVNFDAPLSRLTHAEAEVRAIAQALPGAAVLHIGADNLKRYAQASALGHSPIVHFATHAVVDPYDSRRSRMLFTAERQDAASQYMFGSEIRALQLKDVELVTLAACETERGRMVAGEGVESFSRAFLATGAASSVSSLWRVSDQATAELMRLFYAQLAAGETKAAALRQAKLAFVRAGGQTAHPYYWAPFLLSGDGHTPLTPVTRWWQVAFATLLVLAIAGWLLAKALRSSQVVRQRTP